MVKLNWHRPLANGRRKCLHHSIYYTQQVCCYSLLHNDSVSQTHRFDEPAEFRLVGRSWINYKISVRSNCFPDDNQRNHPQSSLLYPLLQNIYRWGHLKFFFNYLTSSQWKGCCFLFTMPQATMTSHCRWMQIITVTGINTASVSYSTKLCQKSMGPIYKISYDLSQDYLKFIVNRDLR